jgi:hypothetical protein
MIDEETLARQKSVRFLRLGETKISKLYIEDTPIITLAKVQAVFEVISLSAESSQESAPLARLDVNFLLDACEFRPPQSKFFTPVKKTCRPTRKVTLNPEEKENSSGKKNEADEDLVEGLVPRYLRQQVSKPVPPQKQQNHHGANFDAEDYNCALLAVDMCDAVLEVPDDYNLQSLHTNLHY